MGEPDTWTTKQYASEYAAQVNWNRRYLQAGPGDKALMLAEIQSAGRPETWHQHQTPMGRRPALKRPCLLCYPPLGKPEWAGPGLYAGFRKALERTGPKWKRTMRPFRFKKNPGRSAGGAILGMPWWAWALLGVILYQRGVFQNGTPGVADWTIPGPTASPFSGEAMLELERRR
jgi:hypothetical protein